MDGPLVDYLAATGTGTLRWWGIRLALISADAVAVVAVGEFVVMHPIEFEQGCTKVKIFL